MSFNKKIMSGFLIVISAMSCAMEQPEKALAKSLEKSHELKKTPSQPIDIVKKQSPTFFEYVASGVTSSVNSCYSTVQNRLSDDAAFKKLGWPTTDKTAQEELEKTLIIYARYNNYIQTHNKYGEFDADNLAIVRRRDYCQRALWALPTCLNGIDLALFCLENHQQVMDSFDLTSFLDFVNAELEKYKQRQKRFETITMLLDDNPLLNNLFQQTLSVKYTKQKEEEKRKAEEDAKRKEAEETERLRIEAERKQKEEAERIKKEEEERKRKEAEEEAERLREALEKQRQEELAKNKEKQPGTAKQKKNGQ